MLVYLVLQNRKGVVIKSNAVKCYIGNNVIISQLASISHNVKIGDHSIVAPSASCSEDLKLENVVFRNKFNNQ